MAMNRFCIKCGKELIPGSKFCRYCGQEQKIESLHIEEPKISEPQKTVKPEEVEQGKSDTGKTEADHRVNMGTKPEPKPALGQKTGSDAQTVQVKKFPLKAVIIGAVVFLVIAGLGLWSKSLSRKTIDINKVVSISVDPSQYSGNAEAVVDVAYDLLTEEIGKENIKNYINATMKKEGSSSEEIAAAESLGLLQFDASDLISFRAENTAGLSNGDKVKVIAEPGMLWSLTYAALDEKMDFETICKDLKIKMDDTVTYTVSGLPEVSMISLSIDSPEQYVIVSGVNGHAEATLNLPESYVIDDKYYLNKDFDNTYEVIVNNKRVGYLKYILSDENAYRDLGGDLQNVSETDRLILTIDGNNVLKTYLETNGGCVLKKEEINVVIPKLQRYVEDLNSINKEDMQVIINRILNTHYEDRADKISFPAIYNLKLKPNEIASGFTNIGLGIAAENGDKIDIIYAYDIVRDSSDQIDCSSIIQSRCPADEFTDDKIAETFSRFNSEKRAEQFNVKTKRKTDTAINDNSPTEGKTVTVLTEKLRIREKPYLDSKIVGYAVKDKTYNILDTAENDDYVWYKIGEDKYIASKEGEWTRKN